MTSARVAGLPGPQFEARRNKLNSQIASQQDLNDQTIALRKAGKLSNADWNAYVAWQGEWNSFVSRWGKFQTDTWTSWAFGPDESAMQDFEKTCYRLRLEYEALDGVVKSAVALDKPYEPPPSAYDWGKLVAGVVTVGVIGIGLYYGGRYFAAAAERRKQAAPRPAALSASAEGNLAGYSTGELVPFAPPEGYVRTS